MFALRSCFPGLLRQFLAECVGCDRGSKENLHEDHLDGTSILDSFTVPYIPFPSCSLAFSLEGLLGSLSSELVSIDYSMQIKYVGRLCKLLGAATSIYALAWKNLFISNFLYLKNSPVAVVLNTPLDVIQSTTRDKREKIKLQAFGI